MIEPTAEQKKLRQDLITQYGEVVFRQAEEFSGLALCLTALAQGDLERDERIGLYRQASLHLGQLLETVMTSDHSARVSECAKRMDAALDMWMLDEVERRRAH